MARSDREDPTTPRIRHPDQPQRRVDGVLRFQSNPLVEELLAEYPDGLNGLTVWAVGVEVDSDDHRQLAHLIGDRLCGFEELSYVTDDDWRRVDPEAAAEDEPALSVPQGEGDESGSEAPDPVGWRGNAWTQDQAARDLAAQTIAATLRAYAEVGLAAVRARRLHRQMEDTGSPRQVVIRGAEPVNRQVKVERLAADAEASVRDGLADAIIKEEGGGP